MTPLPHNNTTLYFVDYSGVGQNHTAEVRTSVGLSPLQFGTAFGSFLTSLGSTVFLGTVNQVRLQAKNANVSFPVITGIEGTSFGAGAGTVDSVPVAVNFVGRSPGGRRVRLMMFSYSGPFSTFRLTTAESAAIANCVTTLNTTANCFFAIDELKPVWYSYANVLVNAYWQRNVRA